MKIQTCRVREQCQFTHGQVAKPTLRSNAAGVTPTQLQLYSVCVMLGGGGAQR